MSSAWIWRAEDLGGLEPFQATIGEFTFRPHAAHLTRHVKGIVGLTPGRYINTEGGT